tara:strand:+ start:704 stop:868 length:165 start_codon:yes stop_codon:yes gene_type:complete
MTILCAGVVVVVVEDEDEGDAFAIGKTIAPLWQCYSNAIMAIYFYFIQILHLRR